MVSKTMAVGIPRPLKTPERLFEVASSAWKGPLGGRRVPFPHAVHRAGEGRGGGQTLKRPSPEHGTEAPPAQGRGPDAGHTSPLTPGQGRGEAIQDKGAKQGHLRPPRTGQGRGRLTGQCRGSPTRQDRLSEQNPSRTARLGQGRGEPTGQARGEQTAQGRGGNQRFVPRKTLLHPLLRHYLRLPCYFLLGMLLLELSSSAVLAQQAAGEAGRQPEPGRLTSGPEILGVRVGWAGRYKVGFWTPVEVLVQGGARPGQAVVVLETTDSEGTRACFGTWVRPEGLLRWTGPERLRYGSYVLFTQTESGLTVALHEPVAEAGRFRAGRRLRERRIPVLGSSGQGDQPGQAELGETNSPEQMLPALSATQLLLLSIGPASVGLEEAVRPVEVLGTLHWPKDRAPVVVQLSDPEWLARLPAEWFGYEGVDLISISTSRPDLLRPLWDDPKRWSALEEWVRQGGTLVLFLGAQAERLARQTEQAGLAGQTAQAERLAGQTEQSGQAGQEGLAGQGGEWIRLLPGRVVGSASLRSAAGYEMYADSTRPVPGLGRPETSLQVPRWEHLEGQVEVWQGDLPLVVRRPYGLGEVVVIGGDFDRPPLAQWPDRGRFLRKLLALPLPKGEEGREGSALMHTGYRDLSGQLRSSLDQFAGLPMISFWPVAGLGVLYLLLIGPGDYFLLRKLGGRMHWTWWTFSTLVVLTAGAAYGLNLYLKGREVRYNQVDVLDVDSAAGRVRGTTWINLFSPQTDTYTLRLLPYGPDGKPAENPRWTLSPIGLAGEGLGGMRSRLGGTLLWDRSYEWSSEGDELWGLPVHAWCSRLVLGRWWASCRSWPQAHLVDRDQLPEGQIRNTLPVALEECILAYGRWGYALGRLEPGQSVRIEPMSRLRIELPTLLGGGGGQVGSAGWAATGRKPYNPHSHHLPDILRTMMFFDSIGGETYTGLAHRYHSFLDGSGWLRQGRAVLVAQIHRPPDWPSPAQNSTADGIPGTVVLRDGQPLPHPAEDQHLVFVRFVYPVEPSRPR